MKDWSVGHLLPCKGKTHWLKTMHVIFAYDALSILCWLQLISSSTGFSWSQHEVEIISLLRQAGQSKIVSLPMSGGWCVLAAGFFFSCGHLSSERLVRLLYVGSLGALFQMDRSGCSEPGPQLTEITSSTFCWWNLVAKLTQRGEEIDSTS